MCSTNQPRVYLYSAQILADVGSFRAGPRSDSGRGWCRYPQHAGASKEQALSEQPRDPAACQTHRRPAQSPTGAHKHTILWCVCVLSNTMDCILQYEVSITRPPFNNFTLVLSNVMTANQMQIRFIHSVTSKKCICLLSIHFIKDSAATLFQL